MNNKLKLFLIILSLVGLFFLARVLNVSELLRNSLDWIHHLGALGIVAFIFLYIAACVLFLPGSILTLGAGAVYGVIKGSLIVSLSSTLGAACAFLVGRFFVRNWVESKIKRNQKFLAIDEAVAKEGWKIVGLTRLSPIFPFNLLNYAYGVTKVTLQDYILASWIGMMPGTVLYVYIGSLATDIATLEMSAQGASIGWVRWVIRIVGFLATIAVTVYVTSIAKKALEKKVS